MSTEALALIQRGHEAFNRADLPAIAELTTPDVDWGATGIFPGIVDHYDGPAETQRWAETVRGEWEDFRVSTGEVLHDRDRLVVIEERLEGRGRSSGVEVEMSVYSVYWMAEDGKIRKRAAFAAREAALEAAELS